MDSDTVIAVVGLVVGGSGLALSVVNALDVRRRSRLDVFLTLHTRFLNIFEALPTNYARSAWETWSDDEKQAGRMYWHNARAEFLTTKESGDRLLKGLWQEYFAGGVSSGSQTPGLQAALGSVLMADEAIPRLWDTFLSELNRIRAERGLPPLDVDELAASAR